jgi:hypothetical protein
MHNASNGSLICCRFAKTTDVSRVTEARCCNFTRETKWDAWKNLSQNTFGDGSNLFILLLPAATVGDRQPKCWTNVALADALNGVCCLDCIMAAVS